MQTAPQHFQKRRRFSATTLFVRLALIVVTLQLPGAVLAQTPGPGDFAHFTYDRGAPLNVKQVSVKVQDGVTIQDITYTGSNGDTVPAYLVIKRQRKIRGSNLGPLADAGCCKLEPR